MYCMYDRWMDGGREGWMHACVYVWTRINTYEHVWTRMNTYEHVWTRVNTCEHVWTRMNTYEHVWTRMNICWKNVWIRNGVTSICVCIYIYMHPICWKWGAKFTHADSYWYKWWGGAAQACLGLPRSPCTEGCPVVWGIFNCMQYAFGLFWNGRWLIHTILTKN